MQMTSTLSRETNDQFLTNRPDHPTTTVMGRPIATNEPKTASDPLKVPQFGGGRGSAYELAARVAGRINAASISAAEVDELHRERQALLDKLFAGSLTKRERNRLAYVRWSLDRIEDAKHGYILDVIESSVAQYEHLLDEIRDFRSSLDRQV